MREEKVNLEVVVEFVAVDTVNIYVADENGKMYISGLLEKFRFVKEPYIREKYKDIIDTSALQIYTKVDIDDIKNTLFTIRHNVELIVKALYDLCELNKKEYMKWKYLQMKAKEFERKVECITWTGYLEEENEEF